MASAAWAIQGRRLAGGTKKRAALFALVILVAGFPQISPLMTSLSGTIQGRRLTVSLDNRTAFFALIIFHKSSNKIILTYFNILVYQEMPEQMKLLQISFQPFFCFIHPGLVYIPCRFVR